MGNEDIYQKATKKVKAKKGFFYHLLAFVFTTGMLYAIMHFENDGNLLPVIVTALAWGIGLAVHYFKVFGTQHLDLFGVSPNWEEEELKQEIAKLKRKRELQEELQKERSLLEDFEELDLKEVERKPSKDEFL